MAIVLMKMKLNISMESIAAIFGLSSLTTTRLQSLTLEVTPSANQIFKRAYKISHPPGLEASWDDLLIFASSAQSVKIGLSN